MQKKQFTEQITVSVDKTTRATIKSITDKEEIGFSEWIRDAINTKLKNHFEVNENDIKQN